MTETAAPAAQVGDRGSAAEDVCVLRNQTRKAGAQDAHRTGRHVGIELLRPCDVEIGAKRNRQGNIGETQPDGDKGVPMAKARVTDVRSVGGAPKSCLLEDRDDVVREGQRRVVAGGRGAVQESRAPTVRGEGAGQAAPGEPLDACAEPGSEPPKQGRGHRVQNRRYQCLWETVPCPVRHMHDVRP